MTEREIAEVLRAVPCVNCGKAYSLQAYSSPSDHISAECFRFMPDYPAMAHAVVERVGQEERCESHGQVTVWCNECIKIDQETWRAKVADRDACLVRLAEAARSYLVVSSTLQMMDGNIPDKRTKAREALVSLLADAGAGKERG